MGIAVEELWTAKTGLVPRHQAARMSPRTTPLPAALPDQFTVRQARAAGVTEGRLRGPDLIRPHRGVRCRRTPHDVLARAQALTAVLGPATVFSHHTAAALLGLRQTYPDDGDLHVTSVTGRGRVQRPGVVGHRARPSGIVEVHDLRLTDPVTTWADLARFGSVDDCVVLGDAVIARQPGVMLREEAARRHGGRGVQVMRDALPLIRGGESVMETRARLLMHRAGLPEPQLNREVHDDAGAWVACPDFSWPELKIAVEYDGDHHRADRRQWQRDIARRRTMEEAGWRVIVITADDVLRHPLALIDLLRSALAQAAARAR